MQCPLKNIDSRDHPKESDIKRLVVIYRLQSSIWKSSFQMEFLSMYCNVDCIDVCKL
jgi:hypothetical protein